MELLIFWLASIVIAGLIGSKRGAPVTGCLLGLFLGPIGIVCALLIRNDYVACKFCREQMRFDANVCPHCRKEVQAVPKQSHTA